MSRAPGTAGCDPLAAGLLSRSGSATFTVAIGRRHRDHLLARACGHRRRGTVPVSVSVSVTSTSTSTSTSTGQRWTRTIDGRHRTSTVGWNPLDDTLVERFGPLCLTFQAAAGPRAVRLDLVRAAVVLGWLAVALPGWAVPTVTVRTRTSYRGLHVQVLVSTREGRTILGYEGTLP